MNAEQNTNWITVKEASELSGVPEQTVYYYLKKRKVASRRVRSRWFISREDFVALVEPKFFAAAE